MSEETEKRDEKAKAAGAAHVIVIEDNDGEYNFYLKKLQRPIVGAAMSKAATDPLGSSDMIFQAHVIRELSDMESLEDDGVYFSVVAQVNGLIEMKSGNLKRL